MKRLLLCLLLTGCGTTYRNGKTAFHTDANCSYLKVDEHGFEMRNVDHSTLAAARWNGVTAAVTALGGTALLK